MITPRPYISYSQMVLWEMSPKKYADRYIYNKPQYVSKNMLYGTKMAEGLETEEATGDPVLDLMMARIPKFEVMDKSFEAEMPDGKKKIILLAKPDTMKKNCSAFKEYKTSVRRWTQKMADDSNQITFYALAMWLKTKKIPEDIELVNVVVEYAEDGSLRPTGEMVVLKTKRTLIQLIKFSKRVKDAWHGIENLCQKELL